VVPGRRITTEWILKKLASENARTMAPDDLDELQRQVVAFLEAAGSDVKYQTTDGEKAVDLAVTAGERAIEAAGCSCADIDLLLYTGISRGWLEPATANVLQARLNLRNATCFDVLDGCAGWLRGLELAAALLRTGRYRRALILASECGLEDFGRWRFDSPAQAQDYLATYTIGEAATATVVSATEKDDFYFRFANYGEFAGLCMIPLVIVHHFADVELDGGKFYARSRDLLYETTRKIIELYDADPEFRGRSFDCGFGHAASEKASEFIRRHIALPRERYFPTHGQFGNTVSASVPLAMSLALQQGQLRRGHRVLVVVGASGISVGLAKFTY
jgi:3-oxoacyl-[acyl-carrier-protein] synthase III